MNDELLSPKLKKTSLQIAEEKRVKFLEMENARQKLLGPNFNKFLAKNLGVSTPKNIDPLGKERMLLKNRRKGDFLRRIKKGKAHSQSVLD